MEYILASKSPRRKELMKEITSSFKISAKEIDEESSYILNPIEAVKDIAYRKLEAVMDLYPNDLIISADTIVVINNKILGKPKNQIEAIKMLKLLSNKHHFVYTGFCIKYKDKTIISHVKSEVIFNNLSEELIDLYVKNGSPLDKAGAYGIQDNEAYPIIKKVIGSVDNIIGFPVKEIKEKIEEIKK